jgi:hypothetical protein
MGPFDGIPSRVIRKKIAGGSSVVDPTHFIRTYVPLPVFFFRTHHQSGSRQWTTLTTPFHCHPMHVGSMQQAVMHSTELPLDSGLTSPNPKHCPISSFGFHVVTSHAIRRAISSYSSFIPPTMPFFCWRDCPCHRRGAWSEHQDDGPSFSIPIRTSRP